MALQEEGSVADSPVAAEMALYGVYKYAMLAEKTEAWEPWKPGECDSKPKSEDIVKTRGKFSQ